MEVVEFIQPLNYFNYFNLLANEISDDDDSSSELNLRNRVRDRHNPLEYFDNDVDFVAFYRFPRQMIIEIVDLLKEDLETRSSHKKNVNALLQVCISLKFFANGGYFKTLSELFHVDKSTISRSLTNVATALCRRAASLIKFPKTLNETTEIKRDYFDELHSQM